MVLEQIEDAAKGLDYLKANLNYDSEDNAVRFVADPVEVENRSSIPQMS
jgi:hypothetical protein